jgi:hypothetical protein
VPIHYAFVACFKPELIRGKAREMPELFLSRHLRSRKSSARRDEMTATDWNENEINGQVEEMHLPDQSPLSTSVSKVDISKVEVFPKIIAGNFQVNLQDSTPTLIATNETFRGNTTGIQKNEMPGAIATMPNTGIDLVIKTDKVVKVDHILELQTTQSTLAELEKKYNALADDYSMKVEDNKKATQDALNARTELASAKTQHAEHVKKLKERFTTNTAEQNARHAALQQRCEEATNEKQKAESEARELRKINQKLKVENAGLQKKIATDAQCYTREAGSTKKEAEDLKERVRHLEIVCQFQEGSVHRANEELHAVAELNDFLDERHHYFESRFAELEVLDRIEEYLETEREHNRELMGEVRELEKKTAKLPHLEDMEKDLILRERQCREFLLKIEDLEDKVAELEEDRDIKAPLLEKAIDIRVRFMVQARNLLFDTPLSDNDREKVRIGNASAHGGCGLADEALFLAGIVDQDEWSQTFEQLYDKKPGEFVQYLPNHRKAADCKATVQTVMAVDGDCDWSDMRDELLDGAKSLLGSSGEGLSVDFCLDVLQRKTDRFVSCVRRGRRGHGKRNQVSVSYRVQCFTARLLIQINHRVGTDLRKKNRRLLKASSTMTTFFPIQRNMAKERKIVLMSYIERPPRLENQEGNEGNEGISGMHNLAGLDNEMMSRKLGDICSHDCLDISVCPSVV